MKSTGGAHFVALDHVRALAAFMVFAWHFTHGSNGYPVPFEVTPSLLLAPFVLLDEGHTGVALFMALSGYLFAKLLDDKRVVYSAFFWNRALRLLPLLAVVIAVDFIDDRLRGGSGLLYVLKILQGVVLPILPNGGWSITVEFQFYLLLPLLLFLFRRSPLWLIAVLGAALALRTGLLIERGEIQSLAYWTLIGRVDQFVLGILAFRFRSSMRHRHIAAAALGVAFIAIYWAFATSGGFYQRPSYPSPSSIWLFLPTIEGVAYAFLIAWYDSSFEPGTRGISGVIGRFGAHSYSLYLLHFFWVFDLARWIDTHLVSLANFYVACAWAMVGYLLMMPVAYLSYRFIESPFLRLRRPYVR